MIFKLSLYAFCLCLVTSAISHVHAQDAHVFNYTYLELEYASYSDFLSQNVGGDGLWDGDSLRFSGSFAISDNLYISASYLDSDGEFVLSTGALEFDGLGIGGGVHTPLCNWADMVFSATYFTGELNSAGVVEDTDITEWGFGFRILAADWLELEPYFSDSEGDISSLSQGFNIGSHIGLRSLISLSDTVDLCVTTEEFEEFGIAFRLHF